MKQVLNVFLFSLLLLALNSCKKDEGKLPLIEFRTGTGYTTSDTTVSGGSIVKIGILAAKTEEEDVLKKFSISLSLNGGKDSTIYSYDLTTNDEDQFDFDFNPILGFVDGDNYKFTFTITNRDGLNNQVHLTLTTKSPNLPYISFKTGAGYTYQDATLAGGSVVTIGIHANKTEENNVLTKFNASVYLEGVLVTSDDTDLTGNDQDVYDVNYTFPVPPTPGFHYKLTFTVTNRDGLTNQVSLTLTAN